MFHVKHILRFGLPHLRPFFYTHPMQITLPDITATEALASKLAALSRKGDVITLRGTLGTGKTTFSRAFIHALAPDAGEVVSPTFSLLQVYAAPACDIWHMDLYRLKHGEEALELGLEDGLATSLLLIEWPEVIEYLLPADRLDITLEHGNTPEERNVTLTAHGNWKERI